MNQPEAVAHFRELHKRRPLILPNAWDAASARVIEGAGAPAIATTSAGVSWSFGRADGQRLRREEMLQVIGNIVESVRVPVSADMESAYGNGSGKDIADTVQMLISMGVAGINLEDSPGREGQTLLAPEEQAERIRVARQSATSTSAEQPVRRYSGARTAVPACRRGLCVCAGRRRYQHACRAGQGHRRTSKRNGNAGSAERKAVRRNRCGSRKCRPVDRSSGASSGETGRA